MNLNFYNTLSQKKEPFEKTGEVLMYNCGPTVYDFVSIGNLRSYVFADTLRRTFEYFGLEVKQVINITDVGHLVSDGDEGEDKMEKGAKREGKNAYEIAQMYEKAFYEDLKSLNIETENTKFPRATEHIEEQIEIIKILEEKGFTYKISDGIYFDTSKFKDYGKLGNIKAGKESRIGENKEKRSSADFALWKFSPPDEKREMEWSSPWGVGFPGWHIECSAMSRKYLGQPFDIHTGGVDHIPVHHNNEIAQSEAAFGTPLAHFWLHNEFLRVDNEKMSKSLGNTYTISNLVEKRVHPLSFRYWLLTSRYNTPTNFTWEAVEGAQNALENIVSEFDSLSEELEEDLQKNIIGEFEEAIADDLNTPIAISVLQKAKGKETILKMDKVLGLNIKELSKQINHLPDEIRDLAKQRETARESKDWKLSDDLRDKIEHKGFRVMDSDKGSKIQNTLANLVVDIS